MNAIVALGVDAGFACTGWGVVSQMGSVCSLRAQGTIRTTPADGDAATRLLWICDSLEKAIRAWQPQVVAVEATEYRPRQGRAEHVSHDGLLRAANCVGLALATALLVVPNAKVLELTNGHWRSALGIRKAEDVAARLRVLLGPDVAGSEHSRDGLGIALAALGRVS